MNRATFRKGAFHAEATEMFFVLGDSARILLHDQVVALGAGDSLAVAPNVPHAFAPAPGEEGELLVVFTPGLCRFDYHRLPERVYRGEASVQDIRDSSEVYDNHNHYFDGPVWTQSLAQG